MKYDNVLKGRRLNRRRSGIIIIYFRPYIQNLHICPHIWTSTAFGGGEGGSVNSEADRKLNVIIWAETSWMRLEASTLRAERDVQGRRQELER